MTENQLATQIVDAAFKVHSSLGPGLLETVYEAALAYELTKRESLFQFNAAFPQFMKTCVWKLVSEQTLLLRIK